MVVVISGDSAVRPAVHMEWERALAKGKRIIVIDLRLEVLGGKRL